MRRAGVVWVQNQGIEENPIESTIIPLGIGATYAGAAFPTTGFARIAGFAYPDVDGTLLIEQSHDGTNWDYQSEFAITGSDPTDSGFVVDVVAKYAKISYTNGGVAQTTFRMYAYRRYS